VKGSPLAFLRELEREDAGIAAVLVELDGLAAEVEAVRRRSAEIEGLLERMPRERARRGAAVARAEKEAAEAASRLREAAAALREAESGRDRDRLARARRAEVRARDLGGVAARRLEEARADLAVLEAGAASAEEEAPRLEAAAHALASRLSGRERVADEAGREPPPGLGGVRTWASGARAALFVARGALAREREATIRQANELGSALLRDPLSGLTPEAVTRRVESELDRMHP
jgi:chromosome segregation ATPase